MVQDLLLKIDTYRVIEPSPHSIYTVISHVAFSLRFQTKFCMFFSFPKRAECRIGLNHLTLNHPLQE